MGKITYSNNIPKFAIDQFEKTYESQLKSSSLQDVHFEYYAKGCLMYGSSHLSNPKGYPIDIEVQLLDNKNETRLQKLEFDTFYWDPINCKVSLVCESIDPKVRNSFVRMYHFGHGLYSEVLEYGYVPENGFYSDVFKDVHNTRFHYWRKLTHQGVLYLDKYLLNGMSVVDGCERDRYFSDIKDCNKSIN